MFLKKMMTLTMAGLIPIIKFNSSSLSYPVYPAHRQIMKFNYLSKFPPSSNSVKRVVLKPAFCSTVQQVEQQEEKIGISCEPCNGRGWLLCDFCNGQKINVKSPTNRIYRRCPTCKATGYTLCLKCKVYKCVTFPDENDGEQLAF